MILRPTALTAGQSAAGCSAACLTLGTLFLSACAHIPVVDETQLLKEAQGTEQIRVYGAHGPLTARQSQAVLARVAAQAPDADALQRHLAAEQIVAESPLYTGNDVRVLRDGSQTFPAMFDVIASAQHFLYLEYYIFEDVESEGRQLGDLLIVRRRGTARLRSSRPGPSSLRWARSRR